MYNETLIAVIVGVLTGLIIGYLIAKLRFRISMNKERKNAINKSKAAIIGEVNEKIAPLQENFPYNFKDLTFIGKGIDYIVFDGLHQGALKEIVFLEIKTGKSGLNKNEKSIKNAVSEKKIRYEIRKL